METTSSTHTSLFDQTRQLAPRREQVAQQIHQQKVNDWVSKIIDDHLLAEKLARTLDSKTKTANIIIKCPALILCSFFGPVPLFSEEELAANARIEARKEARKEANEKEIENFNFLFKNHTEIKRAINQSEYARKHHLSITLKEKTIRNKTYHWQTDSICLMVKIKPNQEKRRKQCNLL